MNMNELKAEIARNGLTIPELAKEMGISKKRLYARINLERCFKQSEICAIAEILNLSNEAIIKIFFAEKVS